MKFLVKTEIEAKSMADAIEIRDELVGGLEDARESDLLPEGGEATVGELVEVESERDLAIIELARDRHCLTDDRQVEEGGIVSESDSGAWVQGWLWVPADVINDAVGEPEDDEPDELVESEGGHCD